MPSKKNKRKARQEAAKRLAQQQPPASRWLKRHGKNALSRIRQAWRAQGRYLRALWKVVGAIAALFSILSAIISFLPRLSVLPLTPMREPYPFSTPFTVSNDGPITLNDVVCECKIANFETSKTQKDFMVIRDNTVADPALKVLAPSEKTTTTCRTFVDVEGGSPVPQQADVSITVSYRLSIVPWHMSQTFRFISKYDSSGKIQWFPVTADRNRF